jgi:membrane protease YdiL (CAAX protease family)
MLGPSFPRGLRLPLLLLPLAWMLFYPIRIARRRVGLPTLPSLRVAVIDTLIALIAVLAIMPILMGVIPVLVRLFGEGEAPGETFGPIAGSADPLQMLALVVLLAAMGAVSEEVFFRGPLYNALRQRLHPLPAAMIQAAAFGLLHPFGLAYRVAITGAGLCLGLYYEWRKRLLAPILVHSLMNTAALAVIFSTMAASVNAPVLGVYGTQRPDGCLLTEVIPDSAAEAAGMRTGDVVTAVAGEPVVGLREMARVVRTKQVGDKVPVDFIRDGQSHRVEATLKKRPR